MKSLFKNLLRSIAKDFALGFAQFSLSRPADSLRQELQRRAMVKSVDLIEEHMSEALFCTDKLQHLEYALSLKSEGLIAEFGVYKGTTINSIAQQCPTEKVYGFDAFEGLPEHWTGNRYSRANFNRKGKPPKVAGNVELVIGWFHETLPTFLAQNPGPFGFVHIDCDIYSSTEQVFDLIADRIVPGTIIVFDEFFNYHGFELHEYKAFYELIEANDLSFEFISFSGQEVGVRIKGDKSSKT